MDSLNDLVKNKTPIGLIRIHPESKIIKEQHVNRSFETASYSETTQLEPGVYPIRVGESPYQTNGKHFFYTPVSGKVVSDYFPSSFGGHILNSPEPQHVGEERIIGRHLNMKDAFSRHGNIPNPKGEDICLYPEYWPVFRELLQERLAKNIEGFDRLKGGREGGSAVYFTPDLEQLAGSLKIHAGWIGETAETLQELERTTESQSDRVSSKCRADNLQWAFAFSKEQIAATADDKRLPYEFAKDDDAPLEAGSTAASSKSLSPARDAVYSGSGLGGI